MHCDVLMCHALKSAWCGPGPIVQSEGLRRACLHRLLILFLMLFLTRFIVCSGFMEVLPTRHNKGCKKRPRSVVIVHSMHLQLPKQALTSKLPTTQQQSLTQLSHLQND